MNIQFLSDVSGNKTHAVIPVEEYEALIDNKNFDIVMVSDEEIFPESLVNELLDTNSKLRTWRKYRKLTQVELADKVGISKEYISLLESGKREGTSKRQKLIAEALSVDIDDLF